MLRIVGLRCQFVPATVKKTATTYFRCKVSGAL